MRDDDYFSQRDIVPPTLAPTARGAQSIKAYNSWIISNSLGLNSKMLLSGPDRKGLSKTYSAFVSDTVNELTTNTSRRRLFTRHHRRLEVTFDPKTALVYKVTDVDCPSSAVEKATCQTVFGQFVLYVSDEDTGLVYTKYVNATQAAIEEGRLQRKLEEVDPGSAFYVERAADPETAAEAARTMPNFLSDANEKEPEDNDGIGLLGIILITAGCAGLLVAIIAYSTISPNKQRKELLEKLKKEPYEDSITEVETRNELDIQKSDGNKAVEKNKYYGEVLGLVERNCPDQIDNVGVLLNQFSGREDLLILTLKNMGEPEDEEENYESDDGESGDDESESAGDGLESVHSEEAHSRGTADIEDRDDEASSSHPNESALLLEGSQNDEEASAYHQSEELSLDGSRAAAGGDSSSVVDESCAPEEEKSLGLSNVFSSSSAVEPEGFEGSDEHESGVENLNDGTTGSDKAIPEGSMGGESENLEEQSRKSEKDTELLAGETLIDEVDSNTETSESTGSAVLPDSSGTDADAAPGAEDSLVDGEGFAAATLETGLEGTDTESAGGPKEEEQESSDNEVTPPSGKDNDESEGNTEEIPGASDKAPVEDTLEKEARRDDDESSNESDSEADDESESSGEQAKVVWTKDKDEKTWTPSSEDAQDSKSYSSDDAYDSSDDEVDSKEGSGWIKSGKEWVQDFVTEDVDDIDDDSSDSDYDSDSDDSDSS